MPLNRAEGRREGPSKVRQDIKTKARRSCKDIGLLAPFQKFGGGPLRAITAPRASRAVMPRVLVATVYIPPPPPTMGPPEI